VLDALIMMRRGEDPSENGIMRILSLFNNKYKSSTNRPHTILKLSQASKTASSSSFWLFVCFTKKKQSLISYIYLN